MKKIFVLLFLIKFFPLAYGCASESVKREMVSQLYADQGMRDFVCATDTACSIDDFYKDLDFQDYMQRYKGGSVDVCVIESKYKAVNFYTAIFAGVKTKMKIQLISFGTGVVVKKDGNGIPILIEGESHDRNNPGEYLTNIYLWNGDNFIYQKNK